MYVREEDGGLGETFGDDALIFLQAFGDGRGQNV
jgi:hypothetical protein